MIFSEKQVEVKKMLESQGHTIFVSGFIENYLGKTEQEKVEITIEDKNKHGAMKEHWEKIQQSDAILVLNYDKNGIKNYIGGNTFLEIGFAYVLGRKIFLLNPIPEVEYYKSEIEAARPIILHGDLNEIR